MPYQQYDIVIACPELGGKIFAIVATDPANSKYPYSAVRLDKGPFTKRFRLADDQILSKIGTLLPEALQLNPATFNFSTPKNWRIGQAFASVMAEQAPHEQDRQRWRRLATCVPGDTIRINIQSRSGYSLEQHRFLEVLPTGQKYQFTAVNAKGTVYKFSLDMLPLEFESMAKRSSPDVLEGSFKVLSPPSGNDEDSATSSPAVSD